MRFENEVIRAGDRELLIRREGLTEVARLFLKNNPDARAIVYIGSVLFKESQQDEHFDTDFIVLSQPKFNLTPEEVNIQMDQYITLSCERFKVDLPYADTHSVIKVHMPEKPIILGPFLRDYGNYVVTRTNVYYEPPADRKEFQITCNMP